MMGWAIHALQDARRKIAAPGGCSRASLGMGREVEVEVSMQPSGAHADRPVAGQHRGRRRRDSPRRPRVLALVATLRAA
jgi:hypothetical protein